MSLLGNGGYVSGGYLNNSGIAVNSGQIYGVAPYSPLTAPYFSSADGLITISAREIQDMQISQDGYSSSGMRVRITLAGAEAESVVMQVERLKRGEPSPEEEAQEEIKLLKDELLRKSQELSQSKAREAEQRERALSWKQTAEDLEGELSLYQMNESS